MRPQIWRQYLSRTEALQSGPSFRKMFEVTCSMLTWPFNHVHGSVEDLSQWGFSYTAISQYGQSRVKLVSYCTTPTRSQRFTRRQLPLILLCLVVLSDRETNRRLSERNDDLRLALEVTSVPTLKVFGEENCFVRMIHESCLHFNQALIKRSPFRRRSVEENRVWRLVDFPNSALFLWRNVAILVLTSWWPSRRPCWFWRHGRHDSNDVISSLLFVFCISSGSEGWKGAKESELSQRLWFRVESQYNAKPVSE